MTSEQLDLILNLIDNRCYYHKNLYDRIDMVNNIDEFREILNKLNKTIEKLNDS